MGTGSFQYCDNEINYTYAVLAYEASTQQIHTPVFDGPLELLLYLVRRKRSRHPVCQIAPIADAF